MPMIPIFRKHYPFHDAPNMGCTKYVNMYLQSGEGGAKSDFVLKSTYGTKLYQDLSTIGRYSNQTFRGSYRMTNGSLVSVFGTEIFETRISAQGVEETILMGSIPTNSGRDVSMVDNGMYLLLVDGVFMWSYKLSTASAFQIVTLPFNNPTKLEYLNNRAVCITNDPTPTAVGQTATSDAIKNNTFWWSDLGLEGIISWDALSFASLSTIANPILSVAKRQGELWFFTGGIYEVWQGNNNPDLPFRYGGGTSAEIGITSAKSVSTIGGELVFMGSSRAGVHQIFKSQGYNVVRISDYAIEAELMRYGKLLESSRAFTYQQGGHTFYCLQLQGDGVDIQPKTLVFDLTENMWHERESRDWKTNAKGLWAVDAVEVFGQKILAFSSQYMAILELDKDTFSEYDPTAPNNTRPLVRTWVFPQIWDNLQLVRHHRLNIDIQQGVVPYNVQPLVMLSKSDDGGATFRALHPIKVGKTGHHSSRLCRHALGASRQRVYEVSVSDPINLIVLGVETLTDSARNQ